MQEKWSKRKYVVMDVQQNDLRQLFHGLCMNIECQKLQCLAASVE
jgi:hypothetical protein